MRARDARAIGFCLLSASAVAMLANLVLENWVAASALGLACLVWLGTRPRMLRVMRRLRGQTVERISYYEN